MNRPVSPSPFSTVKRRPSATIPARLTTFATRSAPTGSRSRAARTAGSSPRVRTLLSGAPSAFRVPTLFRLLALLMLVGLLPSLLSDPVSAGTCPRAEEIAADFNELAAVTDGQRWTVSGARADVAARIIAEIARETPPAADIIQAVQTHDELVIVAFIHRGRSCSAQMVISPGLWRRVLKTAARSA